MELFGIEIYYLLGSLLLFIASLGKPSEQTTRGLALMISVLGVGACILGMNENGELFFRAYRIDFFSQLFKTAISIGLCGVILFGKGLKGIRKDVHAEYYLFMILSSLGLMMLVSSVELLAIFIALELSSFSLYILVPLREDKTGLHIQMESAAKYILFGAATTGVMLFGMSYIFGFTGTTYLSELLPRLPQLIHQPIVVVGLIMILCGFFFKLAVFPFHFWVPDVYQGASNETAAFIATAPKIGAVALLIRMVTLAGPDNELLIQFIMVLSICSMFYGNLVALVQKDIKRMLGFSSIAHAGYVLIGIITMGERGYSASIFYIGGYLLMNLACFLVICKVSKNGENVTMYDLEGLHQRSPLLALTLTVGMFALAGIPPFVGFMGKFMLLTAALHQGYLTLVIFAAINTAISIYYYLSVVRVSYTKEAVGRLALEVDPLTRAVSVALILAIVGMGVAPNKIVELATIAMKAIL